MNPRRTPCILKSSALGPSLSISLLLLFHQLRDLFLFGEIKKILGGGELPERDDGPPSVCVALRTLNDLGLFYQKKRSIYIQKKQCLF